MANILIVDDSLSMRAFMDNTLSSNGHRTTKAESGKQASRFMTMDTFDLIITDIYMPDNDGLETIMSAKKLQPSTPLIAISSNDGPLDVLQVAKRLGAGQCLRKPFKAEDLLKLVDSSLFGKDATNN